jgi:hypothetical protein
VVGIELRGWTIWAIALVVNALLAYTHVAGRGAVDQTIGEERRGDDKRLIKT